MIDFSNWGINFVIDFTDWSVNFTAGDAVLTVGIIFLILGIFGVCITEDD